MHVFFSSICFSKHLSGISLTTVVLFQNNVVLALTFFQVASGSCNVLYHVTKSPVNHLQLQPFSMLSLQEWLVVSENP